MADSGETPYINTQFSSTVVTENKLLVARGMSAYNPLRGAPLYKNAHLQHYGFGVHRDDHGLPLDIHGRRLLPNAAIALVNHNCEFCRSFLANTGYPIQLPDGTPIVYLDVKMEDVRAYLKSEGFRGPGKDMGSVVFGPAATIRGERIELSDGGVIPPHGFPILLKTNAQGELSGGLACGVTGCVNLFAHLKHQPKHEIGPDQPVDFAHLGMNAATNCLLMLHDNLKWKPDGTLAYRFSEKPNHHEIDCVTGVLQGVGVKPDTLKQEISSKDGPWEMLIPAEHAAKVAQCAGISASAKHARALY